MGPTVSGPGGGGGAAVCLVAPPLSASARARLAWGSQTRRRTETVSRIPAGTGGHLDARGGRAQHRAARGAPVCGSEVPRGHARWSAAFNWFGSTAPVAVRRRSDELVSGAGDLLGRAERPRDGAAPAARRARGVWRGVGRACAGPHTAVRPD